MCYVFATLKVENYGRWKAAFDVKSATREESGSKEAHLFRNYEDQNEVMILFNWDNLPNARKYMESDNLRKYLKNVGAEIVNISYLSEQEISI
jgi:heme-degrading monooxygenase HmoA